MVGQCMASRGGALLKEWMILIGKVSAMPSRRAFIFCTVTYMLFSNSHSLIKLFFLYSFSILKDSHVFLFVCPYMLVLQCLPYLIIPWYDYSNFMFQHITFRCILPNAPRALRINLKSSPILDCYLTVDFN